jgi:hypothetical protein
LGNEYYEFARKGQTIRISTWKIWHICNMHYE